MPGEDNNIKKFNLRSSKAKLKLDPSEIPTLVKSSILDQWMEGDEEPYYKIQAINYPIMANGYNYTESFFESFLSKLNIAPIPGSKSGHELSWGKRPPTDLLLIGGKIDKKGNGKGTVYFKNYIPKVGDSGDNSIFIKENKSNMVDYSLVARTRDEYDEKADKWNVLESVSSERNDAVQYNDGAMEQKTNSRKAEETIKGESKVNKEELLEKLKASKANADITLPEIAKALSLEALLITEDQEKNLSKFNQVATLAGSSDPVEFVKSLIEEKKANAAEVRKAKLNELAGNESEDNLLRQHANTYFENRELSDENIEAFKANAITKKLAGEKLDPTSKVNTIGVVDGDKPNDTGIVRVEY